MSVLPPIKYPGGKRHLVDRIRTLWDSSGCCRLVEPFSGGMAVSLGIAPEKALANDINPHVVNFYKAVQSGFVNIIDMENDEAFYYEKRAKFNELISDGRHDTELAASLFYYLNRTCFNGLVRFNKSGLFNVSYGKYKTINYVREFPEVEHTIKGWDLTCGDFSTIDIIKTDFLYVDPPYDVKFTNYSGKDFKWSEQERLISHLSQFNCPIVISNQATERVVRLYVENGYTVTFIGGPRKISCDGDRSAAREVLATKNWSKIL